jgi:hypothetical protein
MAVGVAVDLLAARLADPWGKQGAQALGGSASVWRPEAAQLALLPVKRVSVAQAATAASKSAELWLSSMTSSIDSKAGLWRRAGSGTNVAGAGANGPETGTPLPCAGVNCLAPTPEETLRLVPSPRTS